MRFFRMFRCVILAATIAPLASAHAKKVEVPEKRRAAAVECVDERGTYSAPAAHWLGTTASCPVG